MRPIIFNDQSQTAKINNLIEYINKLSKVDVEVIDWKKAPTYLNSLGQYNEKFRYAGYLLKEDFVWLEYDSIPVDESWLEALKETWDLIKDSPIQGLMSPDFQSPWNMSCPIGVYKKTIRDMVPQGMMQYTFHSWLSEFQNQRIERTALIQHTDGVYSKDGNVRNHLFPRDNWMLRETSVIFSSDKDQSLITDYYNPEYDEE